MDSIAKALSYQKIYDGTQYDKLADWHRERDISGNYVPMRMRKPAVRQNLGKVICRRIPGFMMGHVTFPNFSAEDDTVRGIVDYLRENQLLKVAAPACRKACIQGSVAITFGFRRGKLLLRSFNRSQAWPLFDDAGELLCLVVQYPGEHPETGKETLWRMVLTATSETWYVKKSSSLVDANGQTLGSEWEQHGKATDHNFGFVPAVWVRHRKQEPGDPDGESLLEGIESILEELDYSVSRRQRSLNYTADPQLILQDEDSANILDGLIKTPAGTVTLGKDGKAYYLEISGDGIKLQGEFAHDLRQMALEIAQVVLPDPEKITGTAMSGFALLVLYESMIDLADELKTSWTAAFVELANKILLAALAETQAQKSVSLPNVDRLTVPVDNVESVTDTITLWHPWLKEAREWPIPKHVENPYDLGLDWGPYFESSPTEDRETMTTVSQAKAAGLISRRSAMRRVGPILGFSDEDAEGREIDEEQGVFEPPPENIQAII